MVATESTDVVDPRRAAVARCVLMRCVLDDETFQPVADEWAVATGLFDAAYEIRGLSLVGSRDVELEERFRHLCCDAPPSAGLDVLQRAVPLILRRPWPWAAIWTSLMLRRIAVFMATQDPSAASVVVRQAFAASALRRALSSEAAARLERDVRWWYGHHVTGISISKLGASRLGRSGRRVGVKLDEIDSASDGRSVVRDALRRAEDILSATDGEEDRELRFEWWFPMDVGTLLQAIRHERARRVPSASLPS